MKGDVESLVNKLRAICDLDVNTAQAWQLVRLTAKELEVEVPETGEVNPYLLIEQEEKRKKLSALKEKESAEKKSEPVGKDEMFDRDQSIE